MLAVPVRRTVMGLATMLFLGCQALVGVEDRATDPIPPGCTLPTAGGATLRVVHAVADQSQIDVCVTPSGQPYVRPILRGGGAACPASQDAPKGYAYAEATAAFGVPVGKVDVKVVAAGGSCSAPALSEIKGVSTVAGLTTTVVRMKDGDAPEQLRSYAGSPPAKIASQRFRVVHAMAGIGKIEVGIGADKRLPTDLSSPMIEGQFGFGESTVGTSKIAPGPDKIAKIDADNGYVEIISTPIVVGIAKAGEKKAITVVPLPSGENNRLIVALGDPRKSIQPVRALVCEERVTDGLKTKCSLSQLSTISVDIFNAQLYGGFAQDEDDRRPVVMDKLAKRPSDVMCLSSFSRQKDRDTIIENAKAQGFLYSVTSKTDLDTVPTKPETLDGKVPEKRTTPPCGAPNKPSEVDAAFSCLQSKCSSTGKDDGLLVGGSRCVSANCAAEFIPFIAGGVDQARCFQCMVIGQISDETHAQTKTQCTTDPHDYYGFRGQTPSLILSRFPLRNSETFVLPSTGYRRVVHRTELEIEKDKFLDFYCAEMNADYGDLLPYSGFYGNGAVGGAAWREEQTIEVQRVIEFVKAKSGTKPALIAGDWASSRLYKTAEGVKLVDDVNPGIPDALEKVFQLAIPPTWVPQCTQCAAPKNPYNGDLNLWQFKVYTYNYPAGAGAEASVFFTETDVVTLKSGEKRPMSDRFGFNTLVRRPE